MKKIDDAVLKALQILIDSCGSVARLSRKLEIPHSTILFWLNGKSRHISTDLWQQKVYPLLEKEIIRLDPRIDLFRLREKYYADSADSRVPAQIPAISEEDLIRYELPVENIASFIQKHEQQTIPCIFAGNTPCFAAILKKSIRQYQIFYETIIFFRENVCLASNTFSLLRLRDDPDLHICRFDQVENRCTFYEFNTQEPALCWTMGEVPNRLAWAFPIDAIRICCRERKQINTL